MKTLMIATAARAFDNAPGAAVAVASKPRIEPQLTGVGNAVAMPVRTSKRGSASVYPFAALTAVGMSFGVKNKTAKDLSSIVSNANKKYLVKKTDETGAVVFKTTEMKDATGAVIGQIPTTDPVMVASAHFFAIDIDPKAKPADPDGAQVRVFRDK